MIALIDYGAGNLTSVRKAFSALGAEFATPAAPDDLAAAHAIVVPGVGHFEATRALDAHWRTAVADALDRGAALFGICLGMQWLFEGSAESPGLAGLGRLPGICTRLTGGSADVGADDVRAALGRTDLEAAGGLKVPHVGWNRLAFPRATRLMQHLAPDVQVYFTHSYVAPVVDATAAVTTYGVPFSAAVESGRIAGVQFHPEKSGDAGLQILRNWLAQL